MIILIGASASGKTEIAKCLASQYGIKKVITHTTRPMRVNEKQDVDYHFVSEEAFLQMQKTNRFVETTFYNGNHYGSSKDEIGLDKCIVLDPEGLKSFLPCKKKPSSLSFWIALVPFERREWKEGAT